MFQLLKKVDIQVSLLLTPVYWRIVWLLLQVTRLHPRTGDLLVRYWESEHVKELMDEFAQYGACGSWWPGFYQEYLDRARAAIEAFQDDEQVAHEAEMVRLGQKLFRLRGREHDLLKRMERMVARARTTGDQKMVDRAESLRDHVRAHLTKD